MPTGYTSKIYDNKPNYWISDYAYDCAKAFIPQSRDNDIDTKKTLIPDVSYDDEKISEILEDINIFKTISDEYVKNIIDNEYYEEISSIKFHEIEADNLRQRYNNMLNAVKNWEVPKSLENLKEFMINQLKDSVIYDCHDYEFSLPDKKSVDDYRKDKLESLEKDLEYHMHCKNKTLNSYKITNEWLDVLHIALSKV